LDSQTFNPQIFTMKLLHHCLLFFLGLSLVWAGWLFGDTPADYKSGQGGKFSPVLQLSAPNVAAAATTLPTIPPVDVKTLIQTLNQGDIATAVQQIETGWKRQYEAYFEGKLTSQTLTATGISQMLGRLHRLTRQKAAVIYVVPTPEHLELILLTPAKIIHQRIRNVPQSFLADTLRAFRVNVVNPESQPQEYLPTAQKLYSWLITPLVSDLQAEKIDTLIFCLGGGLRSMPIAALHDGKQFLVEQYNLAIMPALTLADTNPTAIQGTQVLAMGASTFVNKEQSPLPAVPIELAAITQDLWAGNMLLNQDFTLANLKAQRSRNPYGIIHLATHADVSGNSVEDAYIQFWDSQLKLDQMKTLGLRTPVVQLLVLSACKTALGNPRAELGFAGLAVQAGVKAAIASLWSVSDAGTLVLMSEFYQALKTAPSKAAALHQAQIAMLKNRVNLKTSAALRTRGSQPLPPELTQFERADVSHPYYWAGFTLIGNPW
jgi:CHAT domain-containing protein